MKLLGALIFIIPALLKVNGFISNYKQLNLTVKLDDDNPHIHYLPFQQKLDHFGDKNISYWTQRSWENDEFFNPEDSPIFMLLNGEGPAGPGILTGFNWYNWAKKYRAKLITLEHRFFGESKPTDDVSIENLQYLTTQQALADAAYYIQETNKKNGHTDKNKWILFGVSYSGALVAWARLHYPDLVHGAVSSSGPIQAKASFSEFHEVVGESLNYFVSGCGDVVHEMAKNVKELVKTDSGFVDFFYQYAMCTDNFDINNYLDLGNMWNYIATQFGGLTQTNNPTSSGMNIEKACNQFLMNETLGDPTDRFLAFHNSGGPHGCYHVAYKYENDGKMDIPWKLNEGGDRQWMFLMCNELGYFPTSVSEDSLYGDTMPLKYFAQKCIDVFGEKYNEQYIIDATAKTNERNQGSNINVTNVVFTQGMIDPWHALGVVNFPTDDDPYMLILDNAHAADFYDPRDEDNESLTAARETTDKNLNKWLTGS